jgi:hypothetical protein
MFRILLLLLISSTTFSQVVQERNARGADRIIILKDGFRVPIRDTATAPALLNYSGDSSRGGVVYDSTLQKLCFWTGARWVCLDDAAGPGGSGVDSIYRKPGQDSIFYTINSIERAIKDSIGGGGTPGGGQFAIQYSRGGAFAGSQNFIYDSALQAVGLHKTPTGNNRFSIGTNRPIASQDSVFSIYNNNNLEPLTSLFANGTQTWKFFNNITGALIGYLGYATPNALPGIVLFNASLAGRSDIRYANNGVYFTSHSAGTNPEFTNSLGVLIRGNSDATTQVGIGTASPNTSSKLDIVSTTKGVLFPRMTTTQQNAIGSPVNGLQVYNTSTSGIGMYVINGWTNLYPSLHGATGNANSTPNARFDHIILSQITANRTITPIAASVQPGRVYTLYNENSSAFTWTSTIAFLDKDGTTFTVIPNQSVLQYVSDGTNLRVISKY